MIEYYYHWRGWIKCIAEVGDFTFNARSFTKGKKPLQLRKHPINKCILKIYNIYGSKVNKVNLHPKN